MTTEDKLSPLLKSRDKQELYILGIGGGAWGSVFTSLITRAHKDCKSVKTAIYRRPGKMLNIDDANQLLAKLAEQPNKVFQMIKSGAYERLLHSAHGVVESGDCPVIFKPLSDNSEVIFANKEVGLSAEEALSIGFSLNARNSILSEQTVYTCLKSALQNVDIIINGVPSTETESVFKEISLYLNPDNNPPIVISLSKGVEFINNFAAHIVTPTQIISKICPVIPLNNIMYLGGPNIAEEIWSGQYATARLCGGATELRELVLPLLRSKSFQIWSAKDSITHEVLGALKNCYAIGMGLTMGATSRSATSQAVYFANACAEMTFSTHLLSRRPDSLAGPLLADTYVTLLKGRNSWYGENVALGNLPIPAHQTENCEVVPGKGLIQGISAIQAFVQLFSEARLPEIDSCKYAIEYLPTLRAIHSFLFSNQEFDSLTDRLNCFIQNGIMDSSTTDPAERLLGIAVTSGKYYMPHLTSSD